MRQERVCDFFWTQAWPSDRDVSGITAGGFYELAGGAGNRARLAEQVSGHR